MKSFYVLVIVCLAVVTGCQQQKGNKKFQSSQISTDITKEISGEVLLKGNSDCNYYDIAITDDYYAFMDYYSDTLLQVRKKDDLSIYQIGIREKDTFFISYPSFTKYDFENNSKKNAVSVWDNDSHKLKRIDLDDTTASPSVAPVTVSSFEFGPGDGCTNCCITRDKTYAVMFNPAKPQVFFSADKVSGEYHVPAYPKITVPMADDVRKKAHVSDLVVNEEKGVIVAALRFIDAVNFYDLNSDLTGAVAFNDYYLVPIADITGKFLDGEHSKKCFIDICSSDKYVFCLFDGTTDFSTQSVIYVFDWEGDHQATLQADRNLRKIATEKSGNYLLGLSPNKEGGRDVIKYNLKNKI